MTLIQVVNDHMILSLSPFERNIMANVSVEVFRGAFRIAPESWNLAGLPESEAEKVFAKFEKLWKESRSASEPTNISLSRSEASFLQAFASRFPANGLLIPERRWAAVPMPCSYPEACSFFAEISRSFEE